MSQKIVIAGCGPAGFETSVRFKDKVEDQAEVKVISEKGYYTPPLELNTAFRGEKPQIRLSSRLSDMGIEFEKATIKDLDLDEKAIITSEGEESFDFLVLSVGSQVDYGDVKGEALEYRDFRDVKRIKDHIQDQLKDASKEADTRITVCGGGPAGVELVSELNEYLDDCCEEFGIRRIDVELVLLEKKRRILPTLSREASEKAGKYLARQGIDVVTGAKVEELKEDKVVTSDEEIESGTVIWCGGRKPRKLFKDHYLHTDSEDRIIVNKDMHSVSEATVFALGECAAPRSAKYRGSGTSTMANIKREAKTVAHNLAVNIQGGDRKEFKYVRPGMWIDLGSRNTLFARKGFALSGMPVSLVNDVRKKFYSR